MVFVHQSLYQWYIKLYFVFFSYTQIPTDSAKRQRHRNHYRNRSEDRVSLLTIPFLFRNHSEAKISAPVALERMSISCFLQDACCVGGCPMKEKGYLWQMELVGQTRNKLPFLSIRSRWWPRTLEIRTWIYGLYYCSRVPDPVVFSN